LILLRNPKWGPIWWLAYYIPRLSRASLCVSWAFLYCYPRSVDLCALGDSTSFCRSGKQNITVFACIY